MIEIIDFYADWCGPCKMQTPVLESLKEDYGDELTITKVDVDTNELASDYNIQSIPTLVILKDDKIVETIIGYHPKPRLKEIIDKYLT